MATVTIKGDFLKIEALKKALRIAGPTVQRAAVKAGEQAVMSQIALGFRTSMDPYGKKWKALKHRSGQPLLKTTIMSKSFTRESTADTIAVGNNVERTKYHQDGTETKEGDTIIPARKMIPDNGEVPKAWAKVITAAIDKAFVAVSKTWPT